MFNKLIISIRTKNFLMYNIKVDIYKNLIKKN